MATREIFRLFLLVGSAAGAVSVPSAVYAQQTISLRSMDLGKALDAIGAQTGVKIAYDPDAVPGKTSSAVNGARDAASAVTAAIRGTGLAMSVEKDGSITVGNDIVVTARRDEAETSFRVDGAQSSNRSGKSLKELPQGTEVITSALIKQQQALTLNDALRNSAGVVNSIGNVQGTNSFRIRGQTASTLQNGVATSGQFGGGTTSIDTVERIEVLKGPSAILAGAQNLGGVVNIVDKRPSADPILDLSVQYGTFGDKKIVIDASNALNDDKTLSARIIGAQAGADRAYGDYRGRREQVIAPSLRYKTANSDFIIGINSTDTRVPFERFRIIDPATNSSFLNVPGRIGPRDQGFHDVTTRYYASAEQHVTSWFTLSARGSYVKDSLEGKFYAPLGFFDPDAPNNLYAFASSLKNRQDTRSADVYGRFTFKTGPLRHIVSAGYNYSLNNYTSYTQDPDLNTLVSFDVYADNSNLPLPGDATFASAVTTTRQRGFYIQDFVDFGRVHALVAVRRNKYDFTGLPSTTVTTPSFGAVVDITKSISIYGNYSKGFDPNYGFDCAGNRLPNTESQNIEGGLKADFFRKRLSVNASVFQLKQNNILVPDFVCALPDRYNTQGGTVTRGVELTANGEIVPGLGINASYTFSDYKFQNPSSDFGTLPPLLYRHKYSLYLSYDLRNGALKGIGLSGGIFGNGRTYVDSFGQIYLRPQAQLDANLTYKLGRARFNLGVKNITDRKLYAPASNPSYIPYLQPRTIVGTITYSFFQ